MKARLREIENDGRDLLAAMEVMEAAYGRASRPGEAAALGEFQPHGRFVVDVDGRIVATAGVVDYGPFSWLGSVATHPDWRGNGFASRLSAHLVQWADRRGCRTIALDATSDGRPIYERLGFEAVGSTIELSAPDHRARRIEGHVIGAATVPEDIDTAIAPDARAFGADRSRLLRLLAGSRSATLFMAQERSGESGGYLIARPGVLGPGWARTVDVAAQLASVATACSEREAGAAGTRRRLIVPSGSRAVPALEACGFRMEQALIHMRRGRMTLPGRRTELFAQVSFAAG